jgi:small subunit ribosomal protein S7
MSIKSKILNHLLLDGKKKTSEKILLQSFKELQKFSAKQPTELLQAAVVCCMSVFKIHKQVRKNRKKKHVREIPTIIISKKARISLAIKSILRGLKNKNFNCFYAKFYTEVLTSAHNEGPAVDLKTDIQKQLLIKKHFFFNYR